MAIPYLGSNWHLADADDPRRLKEEGFLPKQLMKKVRVWDQLFEPITEIVLPPTGTPNGAMSFDYPVEVDSAQMAPRAAVPGVQEQVTISVKMESFHGKITAMGYERLPVMGNQEYPGLMEKKAKTATNAINRRIEYDALHYLAMNPIVIAEFSTQLPASRGMVFNVATGADSRAGAPVSMMGAPWDDYMPAPIGVGPALFASDPLQDIDTAVLSISDMTGEEAKYLFVGPNTWAALVNHPVITTFLQWNQGKQLVNEGAGIALLHGITVKKIVSFYKQQPGSALLRKSPGRGDFQEDTWVSRNKNKYMQDFATGTNTEFGIMTTGDVGGRFYFPTYQKHTDARSPYSWSWIDSPTLVEHWALQKGYGFFVNDFGNIRRLDRCATIRF